MPLAGHPTSGCLCVTGQQEVQPLLLPGRSGPTLPRGCLHDQLVLRPLLNVPSDPASTENHYQDPAGQHGIRIHPPGINFPPVDPGPQQDLPSRLGLSAPDSVEASVSIAELQGGGAFMCINAPPP